MSIVGKYDQENIFAKILREEEPCIKIFEDEVVLAFMDIYPESPGHALVIPKKSRARNFLDMPLDQIGPYMERVYVIAHAINDALKPDGIRIAQYNGAEAGQTVYHMHFHIIPHFQAFPLAAHGTRMTAANEIRSYAEKITAQIDLGVAALRA